MLSYKNYKLLNEALGQSFTLGVRPIPTIGVVGTTGASEIEQTLEEAKKKCAKCKKMDGDEVEPEPDVEDKIDKKLGKKEEEPEEKEPEDKEPEDKEPEEKEPEEKGEPEEEPEEKPTLFQKKQKAKQKKEDVEFFQSLAKQLGTDTINQKFWDGISER